MPAVVYGPKSYQKYFYKESKPKIIRQVKVVDVPNGIVFPHGRPFEIGVYDANRKFVPNSIVMEKKGQHNNNMPKTKEIQYIDQDVLFIGDMHWHFGHFLLEHLNRVWPVLNKKYKNIKCVIMYKTIMDNKKYSYIYDLLKIIGIKKSDLIVVDKPTQFKNIFVPDAADNFMYTSKEFGKTYDGFINNVSSVNIKTYPKIYVSRENMGERRTFGEKCIREIFEQNGFHVIYPEKMSVENQIKIMSECNVLAGCAGTALHLALFMKPGGTVIQLKRNTKNIDNSSGQDYINNMRGLNGIFIWAGIEKYKTIHYTDFPQIIGFTPYMKKFFTDNNFIWQETSDNEFDEYLLAVKKYREMHGGRVLRFVKRKFIKITACFIPGRERRAKYRSWLKKKLKV